MSAKNIIVGEIRTVLSRLKMNTRWGGDIIRYEPNDQEIELIEGMNVLLNQVSENEIRVDSIDTDTLLLPFIMVLKNQSVTGPIVESVLTAIDTFLQSEIITRDSLNICSSLSVLLEAISRCRFEATDRNQDEIVLVHMLELLRSTISLPIGFVLSDQDIWSIFDTVFINSQEVSYSRLLRKVAERVLRDITVIIFRRFSNSSSLHAMNREHIQKHKAKSRLCRIERGMSMKQEEQEKQEEREKQEVHDTDSSTTTPIDTPTDDYSRYYDNAALHIITFLSSRINPNARGVGVSEEDSNNTLCLCLRLMRMALESCGSVIASLEPLFNIISDEFFKHCLVLALRPTIPAYMLAEIMRIFSFFCGNMRVELKLQIEVFFQRLVFWALEGNSRNPALIPTVLDVLCDLSCDSTFLIDLYVNYDCDPQRCDLMESLFKLLSEMVLSSSSLSRSTLQIAMRIMNNGMKCIDHRIELKLKEQEKSIEEDPSKVSAGKERIECSYHISPQLLWMTKLKKRTLQKGAIVFNQNAKEGIKYLQETKIIPDPATPIDIARFLRYTPGLDKEQIGEYLGKNTDTSVATLSEYIKTFDFQTVNLLTALRMFLDTFRLPGEAQQIDRIMEQFSKHAYVNTKNHDILVDEDSTYRLAFSIIMLNTDLHNPNIS